MADESKTYLINIEDNLDEYIANTIKAKDEVVKMQRAVDDLKDANKTSGTEWEKANANLRNAQKEYSQAKKLVDLQTTANKSNTESRKQLAAIVDLEKYRLGALANQYTINAKGQRVLSDSYLDQVKKVKAAKDAIIEYDKAQADGRSSVGLYSEALNGALGNFTALPGPIGNAATAVKGFGTALKALLLNPVGIAIAAVVGAIAGLIAIFKKFDPIVEKIQRGLGALKAIFTGITQTIGNLLQGQITLSEAFRGLGDAIRSAADEGNRLVKAQQDLQNMTALQTVSDAKAKRQIDELLLQSKDRTKSEKERMQLIDQALLLEEVQYENRKNIALKETEIAEGQITAGRNFTEVEMKELKRRGVAYAIELQKRKTITDDEIKAYADALANEESVLNESIIIREKALNRQAALEDKAIANKEAVIAAGEIEKTKAEAAMLAAKEKFAKELEAYRSFIRDRQAVDKQAIENKKADEIAFEEWQKQQRFINAENLLQIQELANENEFSIQRQSLELQRKQEIDNAEKTGADINIINQKYALARLDIAKAEQDAKLSIYGNFASSIAQLFGENTKIGRIAAVTATTIETYRGAMAAFAQTPGGILIKSLAAASAVALGLASVKKILSTKSGLPGDGGGASASLPTAISASVPAQRAVSQSAGASYLTQQQLTQGQVNALPNAGLTAEDIALAISKLPPPVVTVEDINAKTARVKKVEVMATV